MDTVMVDAKPVIRGLAEQFGVRPEALRNWIHQDEADHSERNDRLTTSESQDRADCGGGTQNSSVPKRSSRPRALFASESDPVLADNVIHTAQRA